MCGSAGSDYIIFNKYVDHSLKMSLQCGKKRVKMIGEREIVYNVYKFMKTESEVMLKLSNFTPQFTTYHAARHLSYVFIVGSNAG